MASAAVVLSTFLALLIKADVYQLDETNFEESTRDGLWYLEFYAPWCGHCKKFAPIYEEASNDAELAGIKFGAIDATSQKQLAQRFGVSRFPTIKFYENQQEYKYSGARTAESLKAKALQMLQPVIKELSIDTFNEHHSRYTVSFLYVHNDANTAVQHTQNDERFERVAMKYRPEIAFYAITASLLKHKFLSNAQFLGDVLQIKRHEIENGKLFSKDSNSIIYAITPSIPNKQLNAELFEEKDIETFIESNRFSPVIELKLGNYKDLVESCQYFAIIFVDAMSEQATQLIDAAEKLIISNQEWNTQSMIQYKQWEREQVSNGKEVKQIAIAERLAPHRLVVSWCNATAYQEWASHTFSIQDDQLPVMLVYTPKEDGYWIYDGKQNENDMLQFVNDVFAAKLEITYTRNWFARKAMLLERWLNDLTGWQIALVFVGVFVFLCGIMILLDYCCSPSQSLKTD